MLGKSPIYTVEDPDQDDEETEEREIITEYRKKVMKLLKDKAQGEFSDLLRDMCIGGFGSIIVWVDEKGNIDYSEYPIQEIIPIYDGRKRLRLLFRRYEVGVWENGSETTKTKVEVYDDRYVTYYTGDSMESLHLDETEAKTGNPIEHKAGRIPVVVCQNQLPAKYSERVKGYGKSDLSYGVVPLAVAYCHGLSDKANLMENADIVDGKYRDATFDSKTSAYCAADADYSKRNPYDLDYDTPMNPGLPGRRIPNHPHCRCRWVAILSGLGIKDRQKAALDQYGDLYYTKAASYDEYAKEVGLPSVKDMVNADNPKKYLRPGETLADLNRQVVRKRFNGQIITVPLGLDIHN